VPSTFSRGGARYRRLTRLASLAAARTSAARFIVLYQPFEGLRPAPQQTESRRTYRIGILELPYEGRNPTEPTVSSYPLWKFRSSNTVNPCNRR
jgi:hypothetical protein